MDRKLEGMRFAKMVADLDGWCSIYVNGTILTFKGSDKAENNEWVDAITRALRQVAIDSCDPQSVQDMQASLSSGKFHSATILDGANRDYLGQV